MLDVAIRGGVVVNSDGQQAADVGLQGGRIVAVGHLGDAAAAREIDATGLYILPGFIDAHSHLDLALLVDSIHRPTLHQGITTVVLGQDGTSVAPGTASTIRSMRRYFAGVNGNPSEVATTWSGVGDYLSRVDGASTLNVAYLVPNGNLRLDAIGYGERPADARELAAMTRQLERCLEEGAVGLSSGLDYVPSMQASTRELAALCAVLTPCQGVYVTHMRGYDEASPRGFDEVAEIAARSGAAIHISHLMGQAARHLPRIDQLVADGVDVTFDSYPYLAGYSTLAMLALPADLQTDGPDATLSRIREPATQRRLRESWFPSEGAHVLQYSLGSIDAGPKLSRLAGLTVAEAVAATGTDVTDLVCKLLLESDLAVGVIEPNGLTEDDLRAHHRHHLHSAGSDGCYVGSRPHPRGWGAFARYLGRYVRELADFTWSDAAWHLAEASAQRFQLAGRGRVAVGFHGDLAVLDPLEIADTSTFDNPRSLARGVKHVLVNGEAALLNSEPTGALPGRAVRRAVR